VFDNFLGDLRMASKSNVAPGWFGLKAALKPLFQLGTLAVASYRFSHWVVTIRISVLRYLLTIPAGILRALSQILTGVRIVSTAEIGPGLVIHTPYGIFVPKCKIGYNCALNSGVVIGARTPPIGNNVYFGPGAKVMGGARLGNNVVVAANALVITDVPDNTTIMGNPARIKLRGGRPQYYAGGKHMKDPEPKASPAQGQAKGPALKVVAQAAK
jgi:serine O-acetyltransferase